MAWVTSGLVALASLALFWVPGLVLAAFWRVRGLLAQLAVAPLLTLAVSGLGALAGGLAGIRWGWPVFGAATGALALVGWAWHGFARAQPIWRWRSSLTGSWRAATVVAAVAVVLVVPVAIGMGDPRRVPGVYDAIGHLSAVTMIRELGLGSSLQVSGVNEPDFSSEGFYGAAWQALVALLPPWPNAASTFTVAAFVPTACAWTLGVAHLTRTVFPARRQLVPWAVALSAGGIALPWYVALIRAGLVPNAAALAFLPTALAVAFGWLGAPRVRELGVVGLALAGLGLTHPNAVMSALVVVAPGAVANAVRAIRAPQTPGVSRVAVSVAVVGLPLVALPVMWLPRFQGVLNFSSDAARGEATIQALVDTLSGNVTGLGVASGAPVVLAGWVGVVVSRRLRHCRQLAWGAMVVTALLFLSLTSLPVLSGLDGPWYGEARRISTAAVVPLIPFAALTFHSGLRVLQVRLARASARTLPRSRLVASVAGVAILAVCGVPAAVGVGLRAREVYRPAGSPALVSDAQLTMMTRVAPKLIGGAVLGSPFAGTAALYALTGVPTVPRATFGYQGPDLMYVRQHQSDLRIDRATCAAFESLGVRYLYVNSDPWEHVEGSLDLTRAPLSGVRLVDSADSASIYEVTGCD